MLLGTFYCCIWPHIEEKSNHLVTLKASICLHRNGLDLLEISTFLHKAPLPTYWLLLGSPMLKDPHPSQQYEDLHHAV